MIKYIGSKRLLLRNIASCVSSFPSVHTVVDLFSGTSRVGHALKKLGYYVKANDHLSYAATLARCYVEADAEKVNAPVMRILQELRGVPGRPGYFTQTFCERSRFFHPRNGERIDAIRDRIETLDLDPLIKAVCLVSLMEAADRVDSTTGVQMAYLKNWAPRAFNELDLRLPETLPGSGEAHQLEASEAAIHLSADAFYIDPPYNQHRYIGNYHIWETLVRWDQPESYGIACKRADCKTYSSPFNSRARLAPALETILRTASSRYFIVSFSNEGFLTRAQMETLLEAVGCVGVIEVDFKRYVGAQIGIYNPSGVKVGKVSHLRNRELIYVVAPSKAEVDFVIDRAADSSRQMALL